MKKIGDEFTKAWPKQNTQNMLTDFSKKLISDCSKIEKKCFGYTTLTDIINASSRFPIEFGTNNCRIKNQPEDRNALITNQLASAYPIIHERVLYLYIQFLEHRSRYDFGVEFHSVWPIVESKHKLTDFEKALLEKCLSSQKVDGSAIDLQQLTRLSSNFPIEFGTNTCRIYGQPKSRYKVIQQQVSSAYPVIHERVLWLYLRFLEHKIIHANKCEKEIFSNLSLTDFVQRLLIKRCVTFYGKNDKYQLLSKEKGCSGFMTVGTEAETPPLLLKNVLSYDEVKLSALLSVSSHSEFLNDGNRNNVGVIETDKSKIERAGVVIGLIGARLSRRDVMEFQDIVISKTQNTAENGYGQSSDSNETRQSSYRQLWKSFYEEEDFLFDKVVKDGKRFGNSKNMNDIFDNLIMKKRYAISFDTLLLESEARAAAAEQRAYIHVVGIGLGVWKTAPQQEEIFLLTFTERLKVLLPKLKHIAFVHFSWFSVTECGELKHGGIFKCDTHPDGGIRTFLSKRNPADKLFSNSPQPQPEHENVLLIVSYAWDGNALPGNEFWMRMLKSSGDSSTACSTLITEIHNPHINSQMVCGENLHIASAEYGVIHISEYSKKILNL